MASFFSKDVEYFEIDGFLVHKSFSACRNRLPLFSVSQLNLEGDGDMVFLFFFCLSVPWASFHLVTSSFETHLLLGKAHYDKNPPLNGKNVRQNIFLSSADP